MSFVSKVFVLFSFSAFLFLGITGTAATAAVQEDLDARIRPEIERFMTDMKLPGMAVAIIRGDQTLYAEGFGVRGIGSNEPVSTKTRFDMASISKIFTATAIMQLAEKGLIRLDAPVTDYLPYFKLKGEAYREITVKQLLTHTAGLPAGNSMRWGNPRYDENALENFVKSLKDTSLISKPGTNYSYSNMGFDILGDIAAKVSGKHFEDYMDENVFKPLGMKDTSFYKPDLNQDTAYGHIQTGTLFENYLRRDGLIERRNRDPGLNIEKSPVYPYNRAHVPCGTMSSNIDDMCLWAEAIMNGGKTGDQSILNSDTLDSMWRPATNTNISAPKELDYLVSRHRQIGLAWDIGDFRGFGTVGHSGSDVGFNTYFSIMPEKPLAFIVLCNADYVQAGQIASFLYDAALGYDSTIDQYGKPSKSEPTDVLLIVLPGICLILLAFFIRSRLKILLIFCITALVATDIYLIVATLAPLPLTLALSVIYFAIVICCVKKRKSS